MKTIIHEQRQVLASRREAAHQLHRNGADGFTVCAALTAMMDDVIITLAGESEHNALSEIALFALGGYGRNELCPKSDVDIMLVHRNRKHNDKLETDVQNLLHSFWDCGLDVGHSVRSIDECMGFATVEVENWASILEARFLYGNRDIAADFFRQRSNTVTKLTDKFFISTVLEELSQRHTKYGNSAKLLEPNIKKSAGGLRDVHTLLWLYRSSDVRYCETEAGIHRSSCADILEQLARDGELDPAQADAAILAFNFLLRTRNEIHFLRKTLHDSLDYSLQSVIADGLGYIPSGERQAVELFMQEYYLSAKTLLRLNQTLTGQLRERYQIRLPAGLKQGEKKVIDDWFLIRGDMLDIASAAVESGLPFETAMEAFHLMQQHRVIRLSQRLRTAITKCIATVKEQQIFSEIPLRMFRSIIEADSYVARVLYEMADLDVLSKFIPEFEALVAFYQHSRYHYYTVDEHTLITLQRLEALQQDESILGDLYRARKKRGILFMTLLLHDIAKPVRIEDHETIGATMAAPILTRLKLEEYIDDVTFLIKNHLMMEQVSFRRNVYDVETVAEFAEFFSFTFQLDRLYLITYADLSAVNPTTWTNWKSVLLQELYTKAKDMIGAGMKQEEFRALHLDRYREAVEGVVVKLSAHHSRERVEDHFQKIDSAQYVSTFDEEEIASHISKIDDDETVSTLFSTREGYTEVTIITTDAPFALSKFCATLSANDANIFDANIFTRTDGIIIDKFRVTDAVNKQHLSDDTCRKIHAELNAVIEGRIDIEHLFELHRRKWKRRSRSYLSPMIRFDVEFEDDPRFTIIDVFAADALGFLYRVTQTISEHDLNITFAKIATRGDGIVDSFYVVDRSGGAVQEERKAGIREAILETILTFKKIELQ
jgi:[protein-PII] uridylyltransferase